MTSFTGVGIDYINQTTGAGGDINLRILAAHIGFDPTRMQRQNGQFALAQLADIRVGQRVEGRFAGLVQRQFRRVRAGDAAKTGAHERQHASVGAQVVGEALCQADGGHAVGQEQLCNFLRGGGTGRLVGRAA